MSEQRSSITERLQNPFLQASIVLILMLLFDLGGKLLLVSGLNIEPRYPWTVSASFLLFFALFNSLLSLQVKNTDNYWGKSILSYIALAATGGLAAKMFSSLGINDAGSYRWLYIVLSIGYLVILSIIGVVRKIVEFAQKEEWEQPKQRKRKE